MIPPCEEASSEVLLVLSALITATPFFLSRLEGSSLKSTFSSYLSVTFTVANFCVLAHATVTSKQVSCTAMYIAMLCFTECVDINIKKGILFYVLVDCLNLPSDYQHICVHIPWTILCLRPFKRYRTSYRRLILADLRNCCRISPRTLLNPGDDVWPSCCRGGSQSCSGH